MGCEERRDELEQKFTLELQNWMKYSQQTQQVIAQPDFEKYSPESKNVVEKTLASTYTELFTRRVRKLNVIESQCDDKLDKLLQKRKMSLILLVANLMNNDPGRLRDLVTELREYKTQLHDGLQSCIERQALQYESRLSSKVLAPEDYCLGPDIEILTVFLNRMLDIIIEEQANFFGDDEDLGIDTPCSISGCQEEEDITHSGSASSAIQPPTTHTTLPPSSSSHTTLPHTHESTQQPPHTDGTQIPTTTDIKTQAPTSEFSTEPETVPATKPTVTTDQTTAYNSTPPTTTTYTTFIETDITPETKPHVIETDPNREQTTTYSETELPTITAPTDESTPPTAPGTYESLPGWKCMNYM